MRGCGWRRCPPVIGSLPPCRLTIASTHVVRSKRTLRARARIRLAQCSDRRKLRQGIGTVAAPRVAVRLPGFHSVAPPSPCLSSAPTAVPHHRLRSAETPTAKPSGPRRCSVAHRGVSHASTGTQASGPRTRTVLREGRDSNQSQTLAQPPSFYVFKKKLFDARPLFFLSTPPAVGQGHLSFRFRRNKTPFCI